jgi:sporulation protein YlmC with PRC-barrel domain
VIIFEEAKSIKSRLLIIPGYLVGLGCLFLITYRTLLAFFSDSKAVTIYVNHFGEQYADLIALVIIWMVCIIGLLALYSAVKPKKAMKVFESDLRGKTVMNKKGLYLGILRNSLVEENTGSLLSILVEPSEDIDPKRYRLDDLGHLVFPFEAIESIKDVVIVGS